MNKKIKHVMVVALAINVFSIIGPQKYMNFMTEKAYADVTGADLKNISLEYGAMNFKASKTDYTVQLDSSWDKLKIKAVPKEDGAIIRINGTKVSESENYQKVVDLEKGSNTITINVENGSKKKKYTVTVIRGHIDEKQIYLKSINLSEGSINFSSNQTDYNVNVPANFSDISIRAIPEDTDYDEEIDGVTALEDDDYKRTVHLKDGDNEVKIRIRDDDDHEKIYTLHINRGTITQANPVNNTKEINGANATSAVTKGWVLNNGQWNYIDEKGDKYIGWKQINGIWYYLDENGAMKTGWQNINGYWYYMDLYGHMKTGWIKDVDGEWYYLYNSGIMAKNTTIQGFKLDSNGTWIK